MRNPSLVAMLMLLSTPAFADGQASTQRATNFASSAFSANRFEIEAAKVEVAKGRAEPAKQYASDMLTDHGNAGPALEASAKEDGVNVPQGLDESHQEKLDALAESDAANLDQAYLSTQLIAHQEAVELFRSYAETGPDGALKRLAGKLLPELRMHLTRVQALTSK
ncbi:DUF4142 domain-containing protein [Rhizobium cauense]|uniref:DUF4142 domain-containing protein n=1 Tax=Rhizobium cauense TaxID=1166683 RepID=UPI001C6F41AD|nr:DUF4142 domain-containing protein [Rhizobium cauense]MBW9117345.1 DUF4142 domain-containing protein [Rhizobium cauense]